MARSTTDSTAVRRGARSLACCLRVVALLLPWPAVNHAAPFLGPVSATVVVAGGAALEDVVVQVRCRQNGLHGTTAAGTSQRVVNSGEPFTIAWTLRGISPAGCVFEALHPLLVQVNRPIDVDALTHDIGTVMPVTWEAFLDAGPTDPPLHSAYRWPILEYQGHLGRLRNDYLDAFSEGPQRQALQRYIPALHAQFRRLVALDVYGREPLRDYNNPLIAIRALEDAVGYPGAQHRLFAAAAANDAATVRAVAAAGGFVDAWDRNGSTALLMAADGGHVEAVEALLDAGVDIDLVHPVGHGTALKSALARRHWALAARLVGRGASRDMEPLYLRYLASALCALATAGDSDSLRRMLAGGVPVDYADSSGTTALMCAAKAGRLDAARLLLDAAADPNARATHDRTALRFAEGGRHADMVALLKGAGAVP